MSGSGRGRAWLRLPNSVPVRPGPDSISNDSLPEDKNSYSDLIENFQILNMDDDGIAINNKIYHIRAEFMVKCPNINLISEAVEAIHEECLNNESFSKKFILFISSAHFENKQNTEDQILWRNTVRKTFITCLQNDFEERERNREKCPTKFFNGVKLCSSFFHNISKFQSKVYPTVEKAAILGYLQLLLNYNTPKDISMITHLVCCHSSVILSLLDDECQPYKELLNKLKLMIISSSSLPESQRFLIFFTYEVLTHRYNLKEDELEFYRSNMSDVDFSEILVLLSYLPQPAPNYNKRDKRTQTQKDSSQQDYSSNQWLQCDNWKKAKEQTGHTFKENGTKKIFPQLSSEQSFKLSEENISCSTSEQSERIKLGRLGISEEQPTYNANGFRVVSKDSNFVPNKKDLLREHPSDGLSTQERVGRPILGVGARLKKM
ncbi:uncharacterized protein LOC123306485 [Coccinella septempunctata]|uniref:uncharacterized protein LOC123306485 n=1 Tax=Coccinella septempunctata TaxID=41139 RepID=UPI001D0885B6|nr:uncharacterized protein LOC123306485 [Coccinella septempunctata]